MRLSDLYRDYSDKIKFAVIYIREAHPKDGWVINGEKIQFNDPKTYEARCKVADECGMAMKHGIKTYVDKMDDKVMIAYAAHPERLYLIGKDGKVAYQGGLGPSGFKVDELKIAIDKLLGSSSE